MEEMLSSVCAADMAGGGAGGRGTSSESEADCRLAALARVPAAPGKSLG
jgi:hypothetical protein